MKIYSASYNQGRGGVDVEGLKQSMKPFCDRVIKELNLPVDNFRLHSGQLHPGYGKTFGKYVLDFTLELSGNLKAAYNSDLNKQGNIDLRLYFYHVPENTTITPELLYQEFSSHLRERIREAVYTPDELDHASKIYKDKLRKITKICENIGRNYGITLDPYFYPSLENLKGTPKEKITLYVRITGIEGKLGNMQPSKIDSGYFAYTVNGVEYSFDLRDLDHRFGVPEGNFKSVDAELDYNTVRSQIKNHVTKVIEAIDEVDSRITLHTKAERAVDDKLNMINEKLGSIVLTRGRGRNLGFRIIYSYGGRQTEEYITEEQALDPSFWNKYINKIRKRIYRASHTPQRFKPEILPEDIFNDGETDLVTL